MPGNPEKFFDKGRILASGFFQILDNLVVNQMVMDLNIADDTIIQRGGQAALQQSKVNVVYVKQLIQVIAELSFLMCRKYKTVYEKYQYHRRDNIKDTEFSGQHLWECQCGKSQGKAGGEQGLLPGSGRLHIESHRHKGCQQKMPACSMKQREKKLQDQAACQCSDKTGFYPGGTFLIHRTEQQEGIQHKPVAVVCLADHAVSEANRQNCAEAKRETSLKCISLYLAKQFLKRAAIAGKLPTVRTLFSAILPNIIQNQQEEAEKILNEYTGNFIALLNLGQKLAACSNQFLLLKSIGSGSLHIPGQAFQQVMPVRI